MERSTLCFIVAAMLGLPAWVLDVNHLAPVIQSTWFGIQIMVALLGIFFFAIDGELDDSSV